MTYRKLVEGILNNVKDWDQEVELVLFNRSSSTGTEVTRPVEPDFGFVRQDGKSFVKVNWNSERVVANILNVIS
jgi:hypothetical protein